VDRDQARVEAIQSVLQEARLDLLVGTLPVNVLLLTGYWPVVGSSIALVARGGPTILLVPEDERTLAERGWADTIHTFSSGSLEALFSIAEAVRTPLRAAARSLSFRQGAIGYECGGFFEPASYASLHLYGGCIPSLLRDAFPAASLQVADEILERLRSVKTPREVGRLRTACRLAERAFLQGAAEIHAGQRETEIAARFQAPLARTDPVSPDVGRAGGFAFCMSGPNSGEAYAAYQRSRSRAIEAGDLLLIHVNSYADGYWTDVTRTYVLGDPDERQMRIFEAILAARAAALDAIRPGVRAAAVDAAAREVLRQRGFGPAFKHPTGHGVGFAAINHNARPRLHPQSDEILETGMVFNVEPGVYFAGYGGARHCDVVAVTADGAELLTPFQAEPGQLILTDRHLLQGIGVA
jgi:Xaa-Pro aminopeptidase